MKENKKELIKLISKIAVALAVFVFVLINYKELVNIDVREIVSAAPSLLPAVLSVLAIYCVKGLVLVIPRKGAEVADIKEKSLRDVLEVRKALEELSVQLACEKITKEEIEELKEAAETFKKAQKTKDITQIAEADVHFHDIINTASGNQKLIQLLNNLREQMYRYRVEYLKNPEVYPQLIAEHEELITKITHHEKQEATKIMCRHIDNQVEAVTDVIRTKKV